MHLQIVFTPKAEGQLEKLQKYLATRFYPANAERYVQRLTAACHSLAQAPYRGTMRNDLAPGLRTFGFEHTATVYFAVAGDHVVIVSIAYRGRGYRP